MRSQTPPGFIELKVNPPIKSLSSLNQQRINELILSPVDSAVLPYAEIYTPEYCAKMQISRHNDCRLLLRGDPRSYEELTAAGGFLPHYTKSEEDNFESRDRQSLTFDLVNKGTQDELFSPTIAKDSENKWNLFLYHQAIELSGRNIEILQKIILDDIDRKINYVEKNTELKDPEDVEKFTKRLAQRREQVKEFFDCLRLGENPLLAKLGNHGFSRVGLLHFESFVSSCGKNSTSSKDKYLHVAAHRNTVREDKISGLVSFTDDMMIARKYASFGLGYVYTVAATGSIPISEKDYFKYERECSVPGGADVEDIVAFRQIKKENNFYGSSIYVKESVLKKHPEMIDEIIIPYTQHGEIVVGLSELKKTYGIKSNDSVNKQQNPIDEPQQSSFSKICKSLAMRFSCFSSPSSEPTINEPQEIESIDPTPNYVGQNIDDLDETKEIAQAENPSSNYRNGNK